MRGYFGIGIYNTKVGMNVGTLWRSAAIMGASFMFTIGKRYKKQSTDTMKAWRHIPLYTYEDFPHFYKCMPYDTKLVGVEILDTSVDISTYSHPERCVYLLGAEDVGLSKEAITHCKDIVQLPGKHCLNVAVAGSIVMFDRLNKGGQPMN